MCDPITLGLMAAGTAATFVGGGMNARDQVDRNAAEAEARNKALRQTLDANDTHIKASRDAFQRRVAQSSADPAQTALDTAQTGQTQAYVNNMAPPTVTGETSLTGNAPKVVGSALADALGKADATSTAKAGALGKLAGYGVAGQQDALANSELGRSIGVNNNFAAGNMSVLPYIQDYEQIQAKKPSSGLGDLLMAVGSTATKAAGNKAGGGKFMGL